MKATLKYQDDQIVRHLLLLKNHAAVRFYPYSPKGDYCVWKNLLIIEASADETEPMEDDKERKDNLENLEIESCQHRSKEEALVDGIDNDGSSVLLEDWA